MACREASGGLAASPAVYGALCPLTRPAGCAVMLTGLNFVQGGQRGPASACPQCPTSACRACPQSRCPKTLATSGRHCPRPTRITSSLRAPRRPSNPTARSTRALPTVTDSAIEPGTGRKLAQLQPNDPQQTRAALRLQVGTCALHAPVFHTVLRACTAMFVLTTQHNTCGYQTLVSCDLAAASHNHFWSRAEGTLCVLQVDAPPFAIWEIRKFHCWPDGALAPCRNPKPLIQLAAQGAG